MSLKILKVILILMVSKKNQTKVIDQDSYIQ